MDQNKLHIDSALKHFMSQETTEEIPLYSEFLDKLNLSENSTVLIDDVLKSKLEGQVSEPENSWKKTLALLWYRKLRNAGIAMLLVFGLSIGIHNAFVSGVKQIDSMHSVFNSETEISQQAESKLLKKSSVPEFSNEINTVQIKGQNLKPTIQSNKGTEFVAQRESTVESSTSILNQNEDKRVENTYTEGEYQSLFYSPIKHKLMTVSIDPLAQIRTKENPHFPEKENSRKAFFESGLTLNFNFTFSNQSYRSNLQDESFSNTNRNYSALAKNGKKSSMVYNYGLSIEKTVFKNFGFSLGLSKTSITQKQETDFILHDAPVYDIDGSIAGYINIPSERIQETIENKTTYIAMPLLALYSFQLNRNSSLQVNFGSSLLYTLKQDNQKFDYKSLDLNTYQNRSRQTSFNNLQFGCSYAYKIKTNSFLSIGFERQNIFKINGLSDQTEKVRTTLNNITLSFKYKL